MRSIRAEVLFAGAQNHFKIFCFCTEFDPHVILNCARKTLQVTGLQFQGLEHTFRDVILTTNTKIR